MTDVYPPEKRSAVMRRVKSSATKPELAVRRLIWSLGGRYRLNRADLPGKPDIVLPGRRLAIFVHGCFWHGHDCVRGARVPKANRDYWVAKVSRNRARDIAAREALAVVGWRIETVWECEIKDEAALTKRLDLLMSLPTTPEDCHGRAFVPAIHWASGAIAAGAAATLRSALNGEPGPTPGCDEGVGVMKRRAGSPPRPRSSPNLR